MASFVEINYSKWAGAGFYSSVLALFFSFLFYVLPNKTISSVFFYLSLFMLLISCASAIVHLLLQWNSKYEHKKYASVVASIRIIMAGFFFLILLLFLIGLMK